MRLAASVLLLCLLAASHRLAKGAKLVHVQALWRHGDRTPALTYPTDPHQEDAWPVPFGELTTKGMWQHYQQGLKLKEEYIDSRKFINANYTSSEIYVRSSDMSRTMMSAYSNMAGFYSASQGTYPTESQWPKSWSPVPVHTVPLEDDFAIYASPYCPRLKQMRKEQFDSPEFTATVKENEDLFKAIEENGKMKISNFDELYAFANTLMIERSYNLTFPEWVTEDVYERSSRLAEQGFDFQFGGAAFGKDERVEIVSLGGGVLIKEMIQNMEKKISGQNKYLYQVFSGHDATVGALLRTLGAKQAVLGEGLADYAATVILELWEVEKDSYAVRVRFSKNVESPLVTVTENVSGCPQGDFCPFDTFVAHRQKYIIKDLKKACEAKNVASEMF